MEIIPKTLLYRLNALVLTCTVYCHILKVGAVLVSAPTREVTLFQVTLITLALHLVQPDRFAVCSRTELTPPCQLPTIAEAKLPTHNVNFVCAKQVVTHTAPSTVVEHLQSSGVC